MLASLRLFVWCGLMAACPSIDSQVDAGVIVNDTSFADCSRLPAIHHVDAASLLRTRALVVCWVDSPDRIVIDGPRFGVGRVPLEGEISPGNVPPDFVPFGFGSGGPHAEALREHAFATSTSGAFCAAAVANDDELLFLDLSTIFHRFESGSAFFVELNGIGGSEIRSVTAALSAGLHDPSLDIEAGRVLFSEVNDCGAVSLRQLALDGVVLTPGVEAFVPQYGQVLLVTAKDFDSQTCSDVADVFDLFYLARNPCEPE